MKKLLSFVLTAVISLGLIAGTPGDKKTYKLDTKESKLKWTGKKVTGEHTGYVAFKSGEVAVSGNKIQSVNAVVDMTTITCSDIENPEYNAKLVDHLKSDDFFSVGKHNTSSFTLTSMEPLAGAKKGENNYKVKGKLTIKGISNEIEFPARVEMKEKQMLVRADIVFDRTRFDIKYKSASFFEGIADKAIYDDVQFSIALVAKAE